MRVPGELGAAHVGHGVPRTGARPVGATADVDTGGRAASLETGVFTWPEEGRGMCWSVVVGRSNAGDGGQEDRREEETECPHLVL